MTRSGKWRRLIESLPIRSNDPVTGGPVKMILRFNSAQEKVWRICAPKIDRNEPIRLLVLKARREGISTLIEAMLLAFIVSEKLVNALVTAHMKKPANKIWNMSKYFVEGSPLLQPIATVGTGAITIGESTLEVATAGSPESERAGDLTAWHASEAAFYPHPEVMTATMQALPQSDDVFSIGAIESTANGMEGDGELFYDEWERAEAGDSGWTPVFLAWHEFRAYRIKGARIEEPTAEEFALRQRFELTDEQLAWRRWAIKTKCRGRKTLFYQEYPSTPEEAFVQSGKPFFEPDELLPFGAHLKNGVRMEIDPEGKAQRRPNGWLEVFVPPIAGHTYVVGADSSMGIQDADDEKKKHSRSAGCVLDMETLEQVAEYDAVSAPHVMARHLAGIGRWYNHALLAPEVQASGGGGGREILVYLRENYQYHNIHQWRHADRIQRASPQMLGWETNSRTRPRMLARIREVVMEQSSTIHSRALFKQLSAFGESHAGHTEALAGHDDLLFAYGIALMSRSENYYKAPLVETPYQAPDWRAMGIHVVSGLDELTDVRMRRAMFQSASMSERPKSFLEW